MLLSGSKVAGKCSPADSSVRAQVGATFSSFLPGITMAMTRVATGDIKQGHVVIGVSNMTSYIYIYIYIYTHTHTLTHIHTYSTVDKRKFRLTSENHTRLL